MASEEKKRKGDEKKKSSKKSSKKLEKAQQAFSVPHISPEEITLKGLLGKGCFGKVFAGECRSIEVAVKVPKKQNLSKRALRNFCKEVEIMSKIFHPNVCLFMGACTTPGNIQIVQEKLEIDLESKIHDPNIQLSLSQRMQWGKECSQGMAWLHGNDPPIIHRDLKPANMLLDEHGRVKVCDFGLSHFMEEGIHDREPKGTPLYMAPEVMRKQEISERVDVYSMGIILWELLTREDPFSNHDDYDIFVDAVCNKGERPPIPDWCPPRLRALMTRCWDEDYNIRPTFPEIVTALDDVIADCLDLEFDTKVDSLVQDPNARVLWKKFFRNKTEVAWVDFIQNFYSFLEMKIPNDPLAQNLTEFATTEQLKKASQKQLNEYSKLNDHCARLAKAELARRQSRGIINSYQTDDEGELDNNTRILYCLKFLFADNEEDKVTLEFFGKAVSWFAPLEVPAKKDNSFVDRVVSLFKESYFHGNISSRDAENLLRVQVKGTYLVRFSFSYANSFCISFVNQQKVIKHTVVPYEANKGFQMDGNWYKSFSDLIKSSQNAHGLHVPCPGSKYIWMFEADVSYIGGYGVDN